MKKYDTINKFFEGYFQQKPHEMWTDLSSNSDLVINHQDIISVPGQFYETIICGITGKQLSIRVHLSLYGNLLLMSLEQKLSPKYILDLSFTNLICDFNESEALDGGSNHSMQISKLDKFVKISTNDKEEIFQLYDSVKKFCIQNNIQKDYKFIEKIGHGGFGNVFSSIRKRDQKEFAIKKYKIKDIEKNKKDIINELKVLTMINEPSENKILKIEAIYEGYGNIYIVSELLKGGSLLEYIKNKDGIITEAEVFELILSITKALKLLDKLGISHRDIKPNNIMLRNPGDLTEIVVIDFGSSVILNNVDAFEFDNNFRVVGTPGFIAPEILMKGHAGTQSDIFSLGSTIYFFLTGVALFKGKKRNTLTQKNLECNICFKAEQEEFKGKFPENLWDFLETFLVKDPEARITLQEIEDHFKAKTTNEGSPVNKMSTSGTGSLCDSPKISTSERLKILNKSTVYSRSYEAFSTKTMKYLSSLENTCKNTQKKLSRNRKLSYEYSSPLQIIHQLNIEDLRECI